MDCVMCSGGNAFFNYHLEGTSVFVPLCGRCMNLLGNMPDEQRHKKARELIAKFNEGVA